MQDLEWASHGSIHVQATDRERILHPELRDCIGSPTCMAPTYNVHVLMYSQCVYMLFTE